VPYLRYRRHASVKTGIGRAPRFLGATMGPNMTPWPAGATTGITPDGQTYVPCDATQTPPVPLTPAQLAGLYVNTSANPPLFWATWSTVDGYDPGIIAYAPSVLAALQQAAQGNTAPIAALTSAAQSQAAPSYATNQQGSTAPQAGPSATSLYLVQGMSFNGAGTVFDASGNPTGEVLTPAEVQSLISTGQLPAGDPGTISNGQYVPAGGVVVVQQGPGPSLPGGPGTVQPIPVTVIQTNVPAPIAGTSAAGSTIYGPVVGGLYFDAAGNTYNSDLLETGIGVLTQAEVAALELTSTWPAGDAGPSIPGVPLETQPAAQAPGLAQETVTYASPGGPLVSNVPPATGATTTSTSSLSVTPLVLAGVAGLGLVFLLRRR
jgi:hypothetical protein